MEIKIYGASVLNRRVVLHTIDATPARWRGDAGSSPLDGASTAASSPRNDLVKNYQVHPTHWLNSTQTVTRGTADNKSTSARTRRLAIQSRPRRPPKCASASRCGPLRASRRRSCSTRRASVVRRVLPSRPSTRGVFLLALRRCALPLSSAALVAALPGWCVAPLLEICCGSALRAVCWYNARLQSTAYRL